MLEFAGFHARLCRTLLTQMSEFVTPLGQSLDREVPGAGAIHCGSVDLLLAQLACMSPSYAVTRFRAEPNPSTTDVWGSPGRSECAGGKLGSLG
jgi:hypothetical protein